MLWEVRRIVRSLAERSMRGLPVGGSRRNPRRTPSRPAPGVAPPRGHGRGVASAREIRVSYDPPAVLLTDGAFEPDNPTPATIGGVVFLPRRHEAFFFAAHLDDGALKHLFCGSENPIAEIELTTAMIALLLFRHELEGSPLIGFCDNDAATAAIVRCTSGNQNMTELVEAVCGLEIQASLLAHWERVASASNLADPPSRGIRPPDVPGWPPFRRRLTSEALGLQLPMGLSRASVSPRLILRGVRDARVTEAA